MDFLKYSLLFFLFLVCAEGHGQVDKTKKGKLEFLQSEHDFGEIAEEGGSVENEFKFINQGGTTVIISRVMASCGCTTPGWSTDSIHPGDTGFVKAKYNPINRPGPFKKSLTVTSNAENQTVLLMIKGTVTPKPKTIKNDYPFNMGNLRFRSRVMNMGKVLSNASVANSMALFNESEDTVKFKDNFVAPDHLQIEIIPSVIPPGEKSIMKVTFDPVAKNDLGYSNEQIVLFTDEENDSEKKFSIIATIEEYFPPMTAEERARAPKISIQPLDYDFGTIKQGGKVDISFILMNKGMEDLNIRKILASCSCTIVSMENKTIKPSESATLNVVFDSTGRKAYQYKTISLFTNDPSGPTKVLTIKGKVAE